MKYQDALLIGKTKGHPDSSEVLQINRNPLIIIALLISNKMLTIKFQAQNVALKSPQI